MYEQVSRSGANGQPASHHLPMLAQADLWRGPDRRRQADETHDAGLDWRFQLLDEIDYGIFVLTLQGKLLYANQAARVCLNAMTVLREEQGELVTASARDTAALGSAVRAASAQGLRRLLQVGVVPFRLALAVVPGPPVSGPCGRRVLVILPRERLCQPLSTYGFARDHGLSAAESQVLHLLCDGLQPSDIANRHGVAITTVRTQIASIRVKTDAATIGELIQRIARLPPICSALQADRQTAAPGGRAQAGKVVATAAAKPALPARPATLRVDFRVSIGLVAQPACPQPASSQPG